MRRPFALKLPSASETLVAVVPDGSCTIVTEAPATGPLSLSIVPRTDDVVSCAITGVETEAAIDNAAALAAK